MPDFVLPLLIVAASALTCRRFRDLRNATR